MIRSAKIAALTLADLLGVNAIFLRSRWRRERLLILCYHGIALEDEDQWNPGLYMPAALLRARMHALRESGCAVVPLGEGLARLNSGTLPPAAVSITFDDGTYDFYKSAWPVLREFRYIPTVYLTTYYSEYNMPVFDTMCSYLLWKGRGKILELERLSLAPRLLDEEGSRSAGRQIREWAAARRLGAAEKDALLGELAVALGIDYSALCAKRLLHLMTPAEAARIASEGVDFQLHTHRHRLSREREWVFREIEDNRRSLSRISSSTPRHFCYPGGFYLPEFPAWMREAGIESATTCEPGIAGRRSDPLLLPRLVDGSEFTSREFRAWLSGLAALLPRRRHPAAEGQLIEQPVGSAPVATV